MIAGLSACVTINIYFPAAAAEKAADKIIDDVWQLKDAAQIPIEKQSDPSAKPAVFHAVTIQIPDKVKILESKMPKA